MKVNEHKTNKQKKPSRNKNAEDLMFFVQILLQNEKQQEYLNVLEHTCNTTDIPDLFLGCFLLEYSTAVDGKSSVVLINNKSALIQCNSPWTREAFSVHLEFFLSISSETTIVKLG